MVIRKSHYFHNFSCLAGKCPDSCCKEWDVQIDEETAALYKNLSGELGNRLRNVMADDPEAGTVMINERGRCPMWRQDGLCQIQAELGENALCKTCREYPRLTHDYGDFMELGLELSCPEAARLIFCSPSAPMIEEAAAYEGKAEYDPDAMTLLLSTRNTAISLVENTAYSVPQALILLLFYCHHVQSQLDGIETEEFDTAASLATANELKKDVNFQAFLEFFAHLEILTENWRNRLQTPCPAPWDDALRKLARYGIERYWLQAVSDYDLICRGKLIISSCILVRLLGGDVISTAQIYSKEIENCIENVDAILDGAYTSPALTDQMLISLLQ